ncbi:hypothetical protein R6Q59_010127 [Mikania micrantha]
MVRHKKDGYSAKAKKYSTNPRHTSRALRENEEGGLAYEKPPFKAACWDLGHCDPKRCSGKRLMHFGMMRELPIGQKFAGIVISPNAKKIVSPADTELLEQYGAAVVECSWVRVKEDWAEIVLQHFPYGQPFLEINSQLFKRYAACKDEEEIKKAEETWLAKLEREYAESRANKDNPEADDAWAGGNMNRQELLDSEDDANDSEERDDDGEEEDLDIHTGVTLDLPPDEEDEEEAAEMEAIRRKILASKPFANPTGHEPDRPSKVVGHVVNENTVLATEPPAQDSDAESGSDEEYDDFDKIANATPVTDKTGLNARERAKKLELATASFSRNIVSASKKW